MMHEPVRPVVIGVLHHEIDEEAQEEVGNAAIGAPIVINGRPAMQQRHEHDCGGHRVDDRGEKRKPYFLHDDGAHRAVPVQPLRPKLLAAAPPEQPVEQAGKEQVARRNDRSQRRRYAEKLRNHPPSPTRLCLRPESP